MSKPVPTRSRATNWPSCNASLKQRDNLLVWLDPDMEWRAAVGSKPGLQVIFPDVAMQFCLTMKSLLGLALRQTTGLAESLLCFAGLDWRVLDFSTLSRRQPTLTIYAPYEAGMRPFIFSSTAQASR